MSGKSKNILGLYKKISQNSIHAWSSGSFATILG